MRYYHWQNSPAAQERAARMLARVGAGLAVVWMVAMSWLASLRGDW